MKSIVRDVGQRFMVGFDGKVPSPEIRALLRDFAVGNVILTERNVEAPEQVAELVRELQEMARDVGLPAPLLVAAFSDTKAFGRPWTAWPAASALGRLDADDLVVRMNAAQATERRAAGVRATVLPRLEAFAPHPEAAGRAGAAVVRGTQGTGVAASLTHCPGTPEIERELLPFRLALGADPAMVGVTGAVLPAWDEERPATFSPRIVRDVLRTTLAFAGVVVSADLASEELQSFRERGEPSVLAASAGCDLLFTASPDPHRQVSAIEALIRDLEGDVFPFTRRDEPLTRIRALKERFLLPHVDPDPRQARAAAGRLEDEALAHEIADRAGVTL